MSIYGDNIFNEGKYFNYHMALTASSKLAVNTTIKSIKTKLDSLKSKEEKKEYINKQKTAIKKALTYNKNQAKTKIMKDHMEKNYQALFDFLDAELEKL